MLYGEGNDPFPNLEDLKSLFTLVSLLPNCSMLEETRKPRPEKEE